LRQIGLDWRFKGLSRARRGQEEPGGARSQEEPEAVRRRLKQLKGTTKGYPDSMMFFLCL